MQKSPPPLYHWSSIHGNPFNRNPSKEMLIGKGQPVFVNCWLVGQSRLNPMERRCIVYDRDYVVQFFARKVKLLNLNLPDWASLATEIFEASGDDANPSIHEEG